MKLFTYRGKRVRVFHRKLKGITWFMNCTPKVRQKKI